MFDIQDVFMFHGKQSVVHPVFLTYSLINEKENKFMYYIKVIISNNSYNFV